MSSAPPPLFLPHLGRVDDPDGVPEQRVFPPLVLEVLVREGAVVALVRRLALEVRLQRLLPRRASGLGQPPLCKPEVLSGVLWAEQVR